jgi:hypothetical protein
MESVADVCRQTSMVFIRLKASLSVKNLKCSLTKEEVLAEFTYDY